MRAEVVFDVNVVLRMEEKGSQQTHEDKDNVKPLVLAKDLYPHQVLV